MPSFLTFKCASDNRRELIAPPSAYYTPGKTNIEVDQAYVSTLYKSLMLEPGNIVLSSKGPFWRSTADATFTKNTADLWNDSGSGYAQVGVTNTPPNVPWLTKNNGNITTTGTTYTISCLIGAQGLGLSSTCLANNVSTSDSVSIFTSKIDMGSMLSNYNCPGTVLLQNTFTATQNSNQMVFQFSNVYNQYSYGIDQDVQVESNVMRTSFYPVNPNGTYRQPAYLYVKLPINGSIRFDYIPAVNMSVKNSFNLVEDDFGNYIGFRNGIFTASCNGAVTTGAAVNYTVASSLSISIILNFSGINIAYSIVRVTQYGNNTTTLKNITDYVQKTDLTSGILTNFSFGTGFKIGSQHTPMYLPTNGICVACFKTI